MKKEYGDYVEDILDSMNAIEEFIHGMDFEEFEKDKKPSSQLSEVLRL